MATAEFTVKTSNLLLLTECSFSVNRFERPQINNQSKQALSIMLRQRHPPFMPGNQAAGSNQFNMQQRNQQLQQHQQNQQTAG